MNRRTWDRRSHSATANTGHDPMTRNRKLLLITLLSSLVLFGLAILGEGGFAAFFAHPPLTALMIVNLVLLAAAMFTSGNIDPGAREDRANRWVLAAFAIIAFLSAYIPAYTDRIGLWIIDGDGVRWLGVLLSAAGGALRLWPVFVLGHRFSGLVAIQPGHVLVTNGPYRFIRHPSYLGLMIGAVGWVLAFRSGIGLVLAALNLIPLIARIRAEEALLRSEFGAAYESYCGNTCRLIPGLY
jgi:protein-S-isoprenylcysteine O-methyltransferase Ste14